MFEEKHACTQRVHIYRDKVLSKLTLRILHILRILLRVLKIESVREKVCLASSDRNKGHVETNWSPNNLTGTGEEEAPPERKKRRNTMEYAEDGRGFKGG